MPLNIEKTFIELNTTQILKSTSLLDTMQVLSPLDFEQTYLAFFAVSDYNQFNDETIFQHQNYKKQDNLRNKGAHWSLLIFHRKNQTFYHFDSIKGTNNNQAKLVVKNVNCKFQFKEMETPQQSLNFECGFHVLISAKNILDGVLNQFPGSLSELSLLNDDLSESKTNEEDNFLAGNNTAATTNISNDGSNFHRISVNGSINKSLENYFFRDENASNKRANETVSNNDHGFECSNRFSMLSSDPDLSVSEIKVKYCSNDKHPRNKKI